MSQDTTTNPASSAATSSRSSARRAPRSPPPACCRDDGKLIPYLVSPDKTVPGVSTYYATTCRECVAALRRHRRNARRPRHQARGQSRPSAEPRRALRARTVGAAGPLQSRSLPRADGARKAARGRRSTWDDAITRLSQTRSRRRRARPRPCSSTSTRRGSFPRFLDGWLAGFGMPPHLSVDFEADSAAIEANRRTLRRRVAVAQLQGREAHRLVRRRLPRGWGASVPQQLDFADARAKLDGAPRFVYIGPRRSLTGLNADEWIACKPGTELAIANALAGKGSIAAGRDGRAASPPRTLQRLAARARGVQAGARARPACSGDNALDVALAVAAINQANGAVGTTIKPARAVTGVRRHRVARRRCSPPSSRCARGQVGIAFVRGCNPALRAAEGARSSPTRSRRCRSRSASRATRTRRRSCATSSSRICTRSSRGATPSRCAGTICAPAAGDGSGVLGGHAASTADALIAVAKKDRDAAASYPQADYRDLVDRQFPGRRGGVRRRAAEGHRSADASRRAPCRAVAVVPRGRSRRRSTASQGDFFLVTYPSPVLGDGRGANKPWLQELPDPVTKICGARGSRSTPRRRSGSASSAATSSR